MRWVCREPSRHRGIDAFLGDRRGQFGGDRARNVYALPDQSGRAASQRTFATIEGDAMSVGGESRFMLSQNASAVSAS